MNTEQDDRDLVETFRRSYQRLVDQAPAADAEWPPVRIIQETPLRSAPRGWRIAALAFLITIAFGLGSLISPGGSSAGADPFQVQTETTMTAVPEASGPSFSAPTDAAIAYAEAQEPGIEDPQVTRMIVIYAGSAMVDLRVQVQAHDFCHWYGVIGQIEQDQLEWRGGPALPCDS